MTFRPFKSNELILEKNHHYKINNIIMIKSKLKKNNNYYIKINKEI